ncbi:hypothetical protein TNCV_2544661 [Trichonephila clavipes]|nr:hypothetical protein TNCV_2544661 [Trichonephila clavipes]
MAQKQELDNYDDDYDCDTERLSSFESVEDFVNTYNKMRCAAFPFETGIHFRRKTDFFPEEDTTKSYSGFEPEPTRLQAEGHSHHTGWATSL